MEWIDVNEQLPEQATSVLLYMVNKMEIHEGILNGDEWFIWDYDYSLESVTHWMSLPELPKQPKLTWQVKAKNSDEWLEISDEEFENTRHLARFEFRRIEK